MAADLTVEAKGSLPQQTAHANHGSAEMQPPIEGEGGTTATKPLAFYLGFLGLNINALVFSLDATSLAVAIPVSWIAS
jgi:hypothetical protein